MERWQDNTAGISTAAPLPDNGQVDLKQVTLDQHILYPQLICIDEQGEAAHLYKKAETGYATTNNYAILSGNSEAYPAFHCMECNVLRPVGRR